MNEISIPEQQGVELLLTGNHCSVAPVTAAFPFPYHWVPSCAYLDRQQVVSGKCRGCP